MEYNLSSCSITNFLNPEEDEQRKPGVHSRILLMLTGVYAERARHWVARLAFPVNRRIYNSLRPKSIGSFYKQTDEDSCPRNGLK